ncbi:MBL fold metallo-hydrolase [Rhodococcus sp. ACPA1]|uniref:MBL fold metallo-hydrolase n=1 Tax=Rhodococcus sp. ACPA1 TaxID=2028572 RepID=UPI00359C2C40
MDGPFLERLAQSGVSVDAVDVVFCTHLHHDHCGWNTVQIDGAWVPTTRSSPTPLTSACTRPSTRFWPRWYLHRMQSRRV